MNVFERLVFSRRREEEEEWEKRWRSCSDREEKGSRLGGEGAVGTCMGVGRLQWNILE